MKALSKQSAGFLRPLLKQTVIIRNVAAACTYFSVFTFYFVLGIYGYVKMINVGKIKKNKLDPESNGSIAATISVVISEIILSIGVLLIFYMQFSLKPRLKYVINDAAKYYRNLLKNSREKYKIR